VVDRGDERADAGIVGAGLERNDALPDRRQEFGDGEDGGSGVRKAEPLEAGEREQGGIDLAGGQLAQAGLDVAAEGNDLEIGAQPQDQRLPPQRGGADGGARRQLARGLGLGADEDVARVLAGERRGDREALRAARSACPSPNARRGRRRRRGAPPRSLW
jgi:hypothetical protein